MGDMGLGNMGVGNIGVESGMRGRVSVGRVGGLAGRAGINEQAIVAIKQKKPIRYL